MRIGPPASICEEEDYELHLELTYGDTWEPPPTDDWSQSSGAVFGGGGGGFTSLDKHLRQYADAHGLSVSVADGGRQLVVSRL